MTNKIKGCVLQIITGLVAAGAEYLLLETTQRLIASGWDIRVICFRQDEIISEYISRGIPATCLGLRKGDPRTFVQLIHYINLYKPVILHTHLFEAEVFTWLSVLTKPKLPVVTTRHSVNQFRLVRVNRLLNYFVNIRTSRIIAISNAVKNFCIVHEGIKKNKLKVIHNAIDLKKFSFISEKEKGWLKQKYNITGYPVVGTVGRLIDIKGHRYLLDAWVKIVKIYDTALLLVIGEGPLYYKLQSQAKQLGIENHVKLCGWRPRTEISGLLGCFDVFVLPSLIEGFGIAILEAMATGVPVVATDVGGLPEIIQDRVTGLLVPPRDADSLEKAILEVLRSSDLHRKLVKSARHQVEKNFSIDKYVRRIEFLYCSLLAKDI